MDLEAEGIFLDAFRKKAAQGEVVTVREIKEAYEERIHKKVHKTTVYRLLQRHGWRKVAPRPYHKERKIEEQELFKKTSDK